ncbi:MAG: hypothetical protein R3325_14130 [Thermoanaerobaculia bacterium]|nr:hypothetical protein [Thermoanaerobaculia bacterium]
MRPAGSEPPARPRPSGEECESGIRAAVGDPERLSRLVSDLALSVIEEVRRHVAADRPPEDTSGPPADPEA